MYSTSNNPINATTMNGQYDIKVWKQMVTDMKAANERMRKRINSKPTGYVIVSNTFDHCVGSDENNCATAEVIAFSTQPFVFRKPNAERMAHEFEAIETQPAISTQQMSIRMEQPCGCNLTEHFNCHKEDLQQRYYVELCDEHKLNL